ncbi:hypothetical protein D3C78_1394380 [compost metagenome]
MISTTGAGCAVAGSIRLPCRVPPGTISSAGHCRMLGRAARARPEDSRRVSSSNVRNMQTARKDVVVDGTGGHRFGRWTLPAFPHQAGAWVYFAALYFSPPRSILHVWQYLRQAVHRHHRR